MALQWSTLLPVEELCEGDLTDNCCKLPGAGLSSELNKTAYTTNELIYYPRLKSRQQNIYVTTL